MNKTNYYLKIWKEGNFLSLKEKNIIEKYNNDEQHQAFKQSIKLKTSGWRAKIGFGSNYFNTYNIKLLIKAFCIQLENQKPKSRKILIFHDHRKWSKISSQLAAQIVKDAGFIPYFFQDNNICPTPFLSHLLTNKKEQYCGGIMITASHNNKEFNGCKLFQNQGQILTQKQCDQINELINKNYTNWINLTVKIELESIKYIPKNWKNDYLDQIITTNNHKFNKEQQSKYQIWYSPLHGTGKNWTDQLLKKAGFNVQLVPKHSEISENFFSVEKPNPENNQTMIVTINMIQNKAKNNDLLIINDGDADRIRIGYYDKKWHYFSGNEIATLFCYYLLTQKKRRGTVIKTWVSTPIIDKIVKDYDSKVINVNTGFSNLANVYHHMPLDQFVLAFEESLGYLIYPNINQDKDGIQASLLAAEIHNWLFEKKITWKDYLEEIYSQYQYFSYQTNQYQSLEKNEILFKKTIKTWKINDFWKEFRLQKQKYDSNNSYYSWNFTNGIDVYYRKSQTELIGKIYFICQTKDNNAEIVLQKFIKLWKTKIPINLI